MKEAYMPQELPKAFGNLDYSKFMDELIEATAALEVYMEKISDSKIDSSWFLPMLQNKEALSSSMMEGTQATLDGVLINQISPSDDDRNINEVVNYINATALGMKRLKRGDFDNELFFEIHKELMSGNVRKNTDTIGAYREKQNYIGRNDGELVYTPPKSEFVQPLMNNLISYMNDVKCKERPLIRIAIIHAQFETIHPFGDGNGRVGRIMIPLYLYAQNQISLPFFFISEALERDKHKYYKLLQDIREEGKWNEWIKFFLDTVAKQCRKNIRIIAEINKLYDKTKERACELIKSSSSVIKLVDLMFKYPIFDAKTIQSEADMPMATVNRYLNTLLEDGIIYTDGKKRNRNFYFYDLMTLIRD